MASERPPLTPNLALPMHEAIFWRGVFIHRYSGFEHTVAEMLLRSGDMGAYAQFGALPYTWPKKLARLGRIIAAPGPLSQYADVLRSLIIPLTGVERHRHALVHGMMSLDPLDRNPRELFIKTHDRIDGDVGEVTVWITIEELIAMTHDVGAFVSSFLELAQRIFRELGMTPVSVADREPLATASRTL